MKKGSLAMAIVLAVALAATGNAATGSDPAHAAKHRRSPCTKPGANLDVPQLTFPCASDRLRAGHNFTWHVRDTDPDAGRPFRHPWINVTRAKAKHGVLPPDSDGHGIFAPMKTVKGRSASFTYRAPGYRFDGYWLVTKGTWYVQVQQPQSAGNGRTVYSPVEKIVIR
jgi:hypothetical protein